MRPLRLVVLGTAAANPYAGMAWMHMQIVAGFRRLGHDARYYEISSEWPYDPVRDERVCDELYALPYLERLASTFELGNAWAYRRGYSDNEWLGPNGSRAESFLHEADAVFNVAGTTDPMKEVLDVSRLIYFGTDPVVHELAYAEGDPKVRMLIDEHDVAVTYGENIGRPGNMIPPLPNLAATTRQPVLLDLWKEEKKPRAVYTTVGNWKQDGRDVTLNGTIYRWSKHHEFLKFIDLPGRLSPSVELAMNLGDPNLIEYGEKEVVRAFGIDASEQDLLRSNGWLLTDGRALSTDPWSYRDYIQRSRGEFTVARDLNVGLKSGWFSERSACYLAAGRPVITQDTGFGTTIPTGEGLFAFETAEEILSAFDAIESDYERHSRAAVMIADEFFRAENVLSKLLQDLGL